MSIYKNLDYFNDMGIGWLHQGYLEVGDEQDRSIEYIKLLTFINKYLFKYSVDNEIEIKDAKLDFINYGKTELVFVFTYKSNRYTMLVKQPKIPYGDVKKEYDYLLDLSKKDDHVVKPFNYYTDGEHELYMSNYIYKARCIAATSSWGVYAPDPYRFIKFDEIQQSLVNTCMVAKLLLYYDFEYCLGISKVGLSGGDFVLTNNYENKTPTLDNTLESMYLIALRDKIRISFNDYADLIRREFTLNTMLEDENSILINKRCRVPMNSNDIENGITLGKVLIFNK